jgi:hypothetical protein
MTRLAPADLAEFAAQHFTRDLLRIELRQNYGNPGGLPNTCCTADGLAGRRVRYWDVTPGAPFD